MTNFNVPIVDAPELNIPGEEVEILTNAWFNVRIKSVVACNWDWFESYISCENLNLNNVIVYYHLNLTLNIP